MSFEGRCHCQCKMCRSEQCAGSGGCYPSQAHGPTYQSQQQSQEKNVLSSRYIKFCEMLAKKVHRGGVVRGNSQLDIETKKVHRESARMSLEAHSRS